MATGIEEEQNEGGYMLHQCDTKGSADRSRRRPSKLENNNSLLRCLVEGKDEKQNKKEKTNVVVIDMSINV